MRVIKIFDTTLRDGEQAPGCSMNLGEKIEVAKRLEKLGVDIMEAGFPASGTGDLESVKAISLAVKECTVAALCRCLEKDIDAGREALGKAASPRIHVFLATSPVHMEHKLRMTEGQVLQQAVDSVKYAKKFCNDVEFSAEDAFRSDPDFICRVFSEVIRAGALTVNFPDTVGYAMPDEFAQRVRYVKEHTPGIEKALLSVHCHNDLGLAVANSIAAVASGADQVECTVNGIGERAGNASLEEIVMSLQVRRDHFNAATRIDTTQIYSISRMVAQVTGVKLQPNKAIVGDNAFAHEAGIHQHGVLANRETYEIMTPQSIGIVQNQIILGKHSGRHAFEERLKDLGLTAESGAFEKIFADFKDLADKKKNVSDRDIEALVMDNTVSVPETWKLDHWTVNTGSALGASGVVRLQHKEGRFEKVACLGDGPLDSLFKAINKIIDRQPELELYELGAITGGSSSQGETMVKIALNGRRWNGRGVSTDVIESSIKAYLSAVNAMLYEIEQKDK
ncbi:MAG: 2-isopropylmalate synthase [Treponema sp.]|jgi:2-isopropylmalate synthase|nr:2-isopropylmalate synthase [Treponema sp.]